jgi:hypothetical protein
VEEGQPRPTLAVDGQKTTVQALHDDTTRDRGLVALVLMDCVLHIYTEHVVEHTVSLGCALTTRRFQGASTYATPSRRAVAASSPTWP